MTEQTEPTREAVLAAASEIVRPSPPPTASGTSRRSPPRRRSCSTPSPSGSTTAPRTSGSGPSWVDGGWRVVSCTSSDQLVQPFPGGAVFSHSVDTTVETGDGAESYRERETIVFRADPATDAAAPRLVAVHEHLSPMPDAA